MLNDTLNDPKLLLDGAVFWLPRIDLREVHCALRGQQTLGLKQSGCKHDSCGFIRLTGPPSRGNDLVEFNIQQSRFNLRFLLCFDLE